MIASASGGAGKTTLLRALAARCQLAGQEVLAIDEDAVWGERRFDTAPVDLTTAWPVFQDLMHRNRSVHPDAVVRVFTGFVDEVLARDAVWLQDWPWSLLLQMIGWDQQAQRATALRLQDAARALNPRVLLLDVDSDLALRRALAERGEVWFNRHAGAPLNAPVTSAVVGELAARRRIEARSQDGWAVTRLDATAPADTVAERAWRAVHSHRSA